MQRILFLAIFLCACASLGAQVKRPTNVFDASALDKPAVFQGGQEALMRYLAANLKYPDQARLDKAEGRVIMEIITDAGGRVIWVDVPERFKDEPWRPDFVEESVRVLYGMPDWTPAEKDGAPVSCVQLLPIEFRSN
ncbi:MAG: energy transducer TonB [Saprospiraceae bacterium]